MRLVYCALLSIAMCCAGCAQTIAPKENLPVETEFIGNAQNAGVLGWAADGAIAITEAKRAEYNALIDLYGSRFVPPLTRDAGLIAITKWLDDYGKPVTGKAWATDREHVVKFAVMKKLKHRGDAPPGWIDKLKTKL